MVLGNRHGNEFPKRCRRRGVNDTLHARPPCRLQDIDGSENVHLPISARVLDRSNVAHAGGKMKHPVDLLHGFRHHIRIPNVRFQEIDG